MTHAVEDRSALVDRLAATLQARMVSGELVSGTRLRQEALAEEFGVSRTPIREALRKLQASGLVELQPNRGALVRGPSSREIRDAYEVRAELEGLAAELAAERIQHAQVDGLHEAQSEFRETLARMMRVRSDRAGVVPDEEIERWRHANDRFHQLIQDAAANDVLVATLVHLHRSFPRDLTRIVLGESATLLAENVHEHEGILDAIEHRNAAAARKRMIKHVRHAGALVTLRFEQRG
ncbi:MAG TPA: GntR family transcriptional regulator [Gaiellaceae bacterium]|nr:GntR family transcriptional regulator [Gaiellaceae bacterium]